MAKQFLHAEYRSDFSGTSLTLARVDTNTGHVEFQLVMASPPSPLARMDPDASTAKSFVNS